MEELFRKLGEFKGATPLSWSRVNLLLSICPYQWYHRYVLRTEAQYDSQPVEMLAGKAIHEVLERAMDSCILRGFSEEASGYDRFFTQQEKALADKPDVLAAFVELKEPTRATLGKILRSADKFRAKVSAEQKLVLLRDARPSPTKYTKWENTGWLGYVDLEMLAGGKLLIIDYKSEHYTKERENSVRGQTAMYAYAEFLRIPQLHTVQTGCAYLKDSTVKMDEPITRDQLPAIKQELIDLYERYMDKLRSGEFEPRASKYCAWCGYTGLCPLRSCEDGESHEESEVHGEVPGASGN